MNEFYLMIKDVERQYVNLRRLEKSRDEAIEEIREDYAHELQDADDRLSVLIGLSLALCKKNELIESIATETLKEIAHVIRECDPNKKDLAYLLKIEQSLKDETVYGQEALYKKRSVYVPDWKIGDTFSHVLTCPRSEKNGIKGWVVLLCKVGELVDEFGDHRQLMCVSLCPPEKVPTCKEEFQKLGFLRMTCMGSKTEYLAQLGIKSKRAETACGLTYIGNFPEISFPKDFAVHNLLTVMPLFGFINRGDLWPSYEDQICALYKTNGIANEQCFDNGRFGCQEEETTMTYERLPEYTLDEVERIIKMNDENLIKILPLSIGEYCTDLKYAQDICIYLCENHADEEVRANAVLGLSYLARRFGTLSKKIVPCLETEYMCNQRFRGRIASAIEDIELFTQVKINI